MHLFTEPQEDLEYLAQQISKYPAKSLSALFELLSKELQQHAKKDRRRGRPMRAAALHSASDYLTESKREVSYLTSDASDIPIQEIRFRAYAISRFRYGKLAEFLSSLSTSLEQQKQYIVSGYLKEVQSRLVVAEKISPSEVSEVIS